MTSGQANAHRAQLEKLVDELRADEEMVERAMARFGLDPADIDCAEFDPSVDEIFERLLDVNPSTVAAMPHPLGLRA